MKIKLADIIEKYGMDYIIAINLDIEGMTEISFEKAMCLDGRGIFIDKEKHIYTNDLPLDERKITLSKMFDF